MNKIFLEANNLKKSYKHVNGSITLFNNFNLKIKEGDLVALVGPSGSGKTSLLNIIGSLDGFNSGTYQFNNIDVLKLKEILYINKKYL